MNLQDIADLTEVKAEERAFLLQVCERIERGRDGISKNYFSLAQGALRAAYNGLSGFIEDSVYLDDGRKKELMMQNQRVFDIREAFVKSIEVDGKAIKEEFKENDYNEGLADIKKVLKGYAKRWYKD